MYRPFACLVQLLLHFDSPQVCVNYYLSVVTKCVTHTVFPYLCHTTQINLWNHAKHTKSIATFVVWGSTKSFWQLTTFAVYCGRSRISHLGGHWPFGGTNLWCRCFLVKMHAKMKELSPIRGHALGMPLNHQCTVFCSALDGHSWGKKRVQ